MIHKLARVSCNVSSVVLATVVSGLFGCSGDTSGTAPAPSATTLSGIRLNQHAINMSVTPPANTIQLTATALNIDGNPLPGVGQVTFSALDTNVTVSASGLVTAQYATSTGPSKVVATLLLGNVKRSDTAYIRVTPTAPTAAIETFSIQPTAGDSASRPFRDTNSPIQFNSNTYTLTVTATDADRQAMPFSTATGSSNYYWSTTGNPIIASNVNGANIFTLNDTGRVTFYATSWVYGTAVTDSLQFLVDWPSFYWFSLNSLADAFGEVQIFLGVGGEVFWSTSGNNFPVDIIFDDSLAVDSVDDENWVGGYSGGGNVHIPAFDYGGAARIFPVAGTYHYHSQGDPTQTGTINVLKSLRQ